MENKKEFFMKPSQSFYDSFNGCKVRELRKVEGLSRNEFKAECMRIIEEAKNEAKKRGFSNESIEQVELSTMRQLGESSLFFFCVFILGLVGRDSKGKPCDGYVDSDYGYRLCLDVQENKWRKIWVIAREHFKSTIITCASTLWEIVKDPNATFCIYSYKEDMAAVFLRQIKKWVEDNALLRRLWPDVFWENPSLGYEDLPNGTRIRWTWTATKIEVKRTIQAKECTIEAAGILGSSKTGAHFRYQLFDDTETQKNVETPDAIDKLYLQTSMAFNTGQTDNLDFCFVGTFYARADVYYRMIKAGVFDEAIIQPCVDSEGYPIHFSKKSLEEKYRTMGAAVFATQEMCDPSFNSTASFQSEWFRKWDPDTAGLNIYTLVDPASGKTGRKHDYTAIVTFGIDSIGSILVLDIIRDKIGLEEKFSALTNILRVYHPIRIYYEQISMQQDISSMEMLMDKYHTRFAITPFNPMKWGDKTARIEKLKAKWQMGGVWMPRTCFHVNFEGNSEDVSQVFFQEEFLGYPSIPHDDALDALASANLLLTERQLQIPQIQMDMKNAKTKEVNEDQYNPMDFAIKGRYDEMDYGDEYAINLQ